MVPNSEEEITNILKLPWNAQGNGHLATVSQDDELQTVVEGQRSFTECQ